MGKIADALRYAWRKADKFLSVDCNPDPISLARFRSTKDVATWNVFTDSTFGGNSKAVLELGEGSKTALFTGRYSKLVNEGSQLVRSGYAGFNTVYNRNSDLSLHDYLDVRLRGDGSTYIISMRLDQLSGGDEDAWQAPLVTKSDGEWQDVRLDFNDFIFTFRGRLVRNQAKLNQMAKVQLMAIGITLSASPDMPAEGDFRLELDSISAGSYDLEGVEAARKVFRGLYSFREELPKVDPAFYEQENARRTRPPGTLGSMGTMGAQSRAAAPHNLSPPSVTPKTEDEDAMIPSQPSSSGSESSDSSSQTSSRGSSQSGDK